MNKYQKANEFIRLSEDQKESILENILTQEIKPAKIPFYRQPWFAGLSAVFAVLILYFGVIRRPSAVPMGAPAVTESAMDSESADNAAYGEEAPEEKMKSDYEAVTNSALTYGTTMDEADRQKGQLQIIVGEEAKEIDADSYGEKKEMVILDTEVSVYGRRAAVFSCKDTPIAVVSERELDDEELRNLIIGIIEDYGG